jgi:hypothetical protein
MAHHSAKYQKYIKSKKWRMLSVECRKATGNKCCICLAPAAESHHASYNNLGREKIGKDIFGVCSLCHKALHDKSLWQSKSEQNKMHEFLKLQFAKHKK